MQLLDPFRRPGSRELDVEYLAWWLIAGLVLVVVVVAAAVG